MSAPVQEGEILAEKYRVDRVLGVGGMGVVVAAHHIDLDDKVAIKFLLPQTLGNREAVERFAREARAAVKIKSEHVARVSDVGKLSTGAPYMVMEYLDGGDLAAWLSQRGPLPVEQAVEFILQASEAIAEAHSFGIVHRDLKPANLFVICRPDGSLSVKVLDFGISKTTSLTGSGAGAAMTKTAALMGSPLYMSPEQMQSSKDVDARGDIWALGTILYELVTGSPPFIGETMPELILQIMSAAPQPLRAKRPDAPEGLEAVVLRCLEKDRNKRFQTVGELAVALLPFGPKRSRISAERISGIMQRSGMSASGLDLPPASEVHGAAVNAGTAASWGTTNPPKPSRNLIVFSTVGVVAAVAIGAVVLRSAGKSAPGPTDVATSITAATSERAPVALQWAAPTAEANSPAPSASTAAIAGDKGAAVAPSAESFATKAAKAPRSSAKPGSPLPATAASVSRPHPAAPPPPSKTTNMYDDRK